MSIRLVLALLFFLVIPGTVYAKIGVGVGSGKIEVQDQLKPGMIYKLPSLSVMNTGDEATEYEVSVAYHEKQPELMPPNEWFSYSPNSFLLQPGEAKQVEVTLSLPLRTEPGKYFAYLEAHPAKKSVSGNTTIGVAAAAKLYFTVVPANPLSGVYYKLISFWKINQPWTGRGAIVLSLLALGFVASRFLKIQVGIKK